MESVFQYDILNQLVLCLGNTEELLLRVLCLARIRTLNIIISEYLCGV